jgi:hypothetical protein
MANILTIPESGIYFDSGDPCSGITPILTGNASGVAIQYDGYAGILVNSSATGANYLDRFSVEGSNGRLFGVTDETTGVIFSVNDAAGLPIIEVESTSEYDKITIGEYATDALVISGSSVKVTGSNVVTEGYLTDGGYLTSSTETYSTASELLAALLTVDGTGSNLDADKLDSQESSYYLNYSNFTNTPTIPSAANNATITLLGGSGITTSIGDFTTNQSANETLTISHSDTSSQASVDNNNGTVIQDVFLDTYGHITGIGSTNLDSRYNNYSLPSGTSSVRGGFKIGYSENGKNYPVEVLSEQMFVNVPWTDANTVYTHPTQSALTVDVNANSAATILSTLDIAVNTLGHVTSASSTTRTLTAADLGVAAGANNYSLPSGTSSARGGFKIGYSENGKNYPVEVLSEQMFVNVPWTDANTTYSVGSGISLSGTTFSVAAGGGLTQTATGLSHTDTSSQASVDNNNGNVIQDVFLDTYGHITGIGSTNLDSRYNNYSLPSGTSSARGGFKIGYSENGKNYPVEVLSEQMFVNVPWTDANTVYTHPTQSALTVDVNANSAATILSTLDIAVNTLGHVTSASSTTRTLTAADLGVAAGANNYSLPSGTSSARGGFKIGYSENGKNYPVEVLSEQMFVNVPWTDANTVYTHPTQSALTVDVNANSAATILSTLDIAVNTLGHVTSASSTTRTLTAADLGVAAGANNYSLPSGTSSARGGFKIGYSENGKNYPVEVLSEQMFVNVPWTDANTTYSVGSGISLSGTTFSVAAGGGLTQTATGLSHTDTSSQASVDNNNGTVIQDVFLDTYGHITGIGSTNLDSRYNNYSLPSGTSSVRGGFKIGYSENGKNYPVEVLSEQMFVNVPWTDANTVYTHPTQSALTVDVNANSAATILSTLDIAVNTLGHVTSASSTTRTLTAADLGVAAGANNYSLPSGTSSVRGGFKIGYSENGKNYPVEVLSEQMFVNVPWTDANTVYTHPTQSALTVDVNANSAATILSTLDIAVNTLGHVTSASSTTRTLTAADLGVAAGANNYSLPSGTSSVRGGFKIGYSENGKNYPVEVLSEQMFVNVPWTDANTTYSVGSGISLSGTTFSVAAGGGLTQTATGLSHTDTSSQASVDNNNGNVIQDVFLDTYGHITGIGSTNLDSRYNNYSLPSGTSSARGGFKIGYSENGKNYPVEVLSEQMFVNVPWTDANTVYTHPTQSALTVDVNANSAATILSTLDIAVNTLGHVTSASSTTRTLTAADLGVAAGANNYSLPSGTSSVRGGFKIGYSENGKNYPVEVLSEQMFVNVPWTDANTVYTHPTQSALTVDVNANSAATILSTLDIAVNTLGHVTSASSTTRTLTAANLGITAPNAPTSVTSTIVGQTIDLTFNESSTSSIDAYLVYSSVDGSDYGLIQVIPPADFSSTMSVIDTAFIHTGTQAYRVYAMKYGILSSAGTASVSYTVSSAEPSNVEVINMNNAYYVQWNPPSTNDRFVTSYNVFKHEASTAGALLRASASLVYSGLNTNYMYQINGNNNNNFHQFWVETTIA